MSVINNVEGKTLAKVYEESNGRHVMLTCSLYNSAPVYLVADHYIFSWSQNNKPLKDRPFWRGIILYVPSLKIFTIVTEKDTMMLAEVYEYSFHDHLEVLLVMKT